MGTKSNKTKGPSHRGKNARERCQGKTKMPGRDKNEKVTLLPYFPAVCNAANVVTLNLWLKLFFLAMQPHYPSILDATFQTIQPRFC